MKKQYALLGAGKTGSKVLELINENEEVTIFNTSNPPTLEKLEKMDAIISFLPGPAFLGYLDLLLQCRKPVITGSTGMEWPEQWEKKLISSQVTWIRAHNFALGMNLVKPIIEMMSKGVVLFPEAQFKMHEVHHTKKLDAPSGTALSWEKWLAQNVTITHERIGDVIGDHEITMRTEFEEITIKHRSMDRKIFASGALWATRDVLKGDVPHGLHQLEYITKRRMQEAIN